MLMKSSPCRWPVAKSLGSCAGVIFTAPDPKSNVHQDGVGDDGDAALVQRVQHKLAVQGLVPAGPQAATTR